MSSSWLSCNSLLSEALSETAQDYASNLAQAQMQPGTRLTQSGTVPVQVIFASQLRE